MAEGRMLKRNISDSRRLSELKTDSARMLWTWIIPFLDSEGRFYASTDMIKGKIVPRIKTFTEKNIPKYIDDMARVGLIALYVVDGEKLLQNRNFDVFQKIKKDREAAPLPGPDQGIILQTKSGLDQDQLQIDSGVNRDEVRSKSGLPLSNLREVNLREEKGSLSLFETFWNLYPKKNKKKQAKQEWDKATIPEDIIIILQKQIKSKNNLKSNGQFVPEWPDPERWIKHERWNDEIEEPTQERKSKQQESPYSICPSCHTEVLTEWIENKKCPKCPGAKEEAVQSLKKLSGMIDGIGKDMPDVKINFDEIPP